MRSAAGLTLNKGQCISKLLSISTTPSFVLNKTKGWLLRHSGLRLNVGPKVWQHGSNRYKENQMFGYGLLGTIVIIVIVVLVIRML